MVLAMLYESARRDSVTPRAKAMATNRPRPVTRDRVVPTAMTTADRPRLAGRPSLGPGSCSTSTISGEATGGSRGSEAAQGKVVHLGLEVRGQRDGHVDADRAAARRRR